MKQGTKDLIKGSFLLIALLLFLGATEYIFGFIVALYAFILMHTYKFLIGFILCGFILCLGFALYHYKETLQYIKDLDWKDISKTIFGIVAFAFAISALCLMAKGLMSSGFSGKEAAHLMLLVPFFILACLFVYSGKK